MEEFFERLNVFHKKYARYFLMLLLIIAVVILFKLLPYFIALLLPFVIAWIVSFAASPLVKFLKKKLHVPYMVGAIITVLLLLTLLALVVITVLSAVSDLSSYIVTNWETIAKGTADYFNSAYNGLVEWSESLPFDFMETMGINSYGKNGGMYGVSKDISEIGTDIVAYITRLLRPFAGNVATGTISVVKSLPEAIIFIVMLMLSTYFFTSGREKYSVWYRENTSDKFRYKMQIVKTECFGALLGTLRAQLILTLITAAELLVGFMIMGIDNAVILAVIIAIVDMLPILGVGTVLIPWAVINLLAGGGIFTSIGMIALYLICLSVRNIIQPKILGESMGISSLASLISIWIGYKFYGFIGMLIMPVIATLLYKFYEVGLFDWFFLSHKKVTAEKFGIAEEEAEEESD